MLKRLLLKIIYLALTVKLSYSQSYNINFIKFGYNKGLNSINIKCIVKDRFGFVWVGTQDGLFKFTGTTFKQIQGHSPAGNIYGNDVTDMKADTRNDILWVAFSYGGVYGIDIVTNTVKYIINTNDFSADVSNWIKCIQPVSDREIWIGTNNGIISYDIKTSHCTNLLSCVRFAKDTGANSISSILQISASGFLVFIENKGIVCINGLMPGKPSYYSFKDIFHRQITGINHVFFDKKRNSCWISSYDGLYNFDAGNLHPAAHVSGAVPQNDSSFFRQITYSVQADSSNNLWICNRKGVFKLDLNTNQLISVRSGENHQESKWETSGNVIKIFQEEIWIGTWTGIYVGSTKESPFDAVYYDNQSHVRLEHVYHTFSFDSTDLYICGEKGLYTYNTKKKSIRAVNEKDYYSYLYKTSGQYYLISKLNGLFVSTDPSTGKSYPASALFKEFTDVKDFIIGSAAVYKDGVTIFGSDNEKGILVWKQKEKSILRINTTSTQLQLKEDIVNDVFADGKKNIVILGDNYISIIDSSFSTVSTRKIINPRTHLPYNLFFDMVQAGSAYYIATYGHGILITDENLHIKKIIDVNNDAGHNLSNNSVYRLINYHEEVWASTNYGINRINTNTYEVKQYFEEDGLHSNICEEYSSICLKDKIVFGGIYGFTFVNPLKVNVNTTPPALYFTGIQVDETSNGLTGKADTVDLGIKEYTVHNNWLQTNISFAGLNYINPERVTYQYRIIERDTSWIKNGTQNFITLIGLSPGTYTLEVKAANEDGYWSPVKQLILTFEPKWYQTWWFKLGVFFIIAGLLYAFYRYRISQIKKQQQIRKNVASDLHDDIGSSLNTVKIFAHLAQKKQGKGSYLNEIETSVTDATTGLRDMIWVLDDSQDTAAELMERIKKFALPVLTAKNILLETRVEADARHPLSKPEKRNLYLIAKEAVNNCIKYAACKTIKLQIQQAHGKIIFSILDDGKGFDTSSLTEGNGLKNIHERATQIHYHVNITSNPGEGTFIRLVKK